MNTKMQEDNVRLLFDMVEASKEGEVVIKPVEASDVHTSEVVVVDFGNNGATIFYSSSGECETIEPEEVLDLPDVLEAGTILISEYPHLGCDRKKFSLSQPFTATELLDLYARLKANGIVLKLFPSKSTPRACAHSKLGKPEDNYKSDITDPIAIYKLLQDFPEISQMKPPKSFETSAFRQEVYDYKKYTNGMLNIARRTMLYRDESKYPVKYKVSWGDIPIPAKTGYTGTDDPINNFIWNNLYVIYDSLSPLARSVVGFSHYAKSKELKISGKKKWQFDMRLLYTICSMLVDETGAIRKREKTKEVAGWNFIKRYIIGMSPFHLKGGVARSNVYHWGLKNWVKRQVKENYGDRGLSLKGKRRGGGYDTKKKKEVPAFTKEEDALFVLYRTQYCNSVRELFKVMKKMLKEGC